MNGVTHTTFRSACQALNSLDNDRYKDVCINDACNMPRPNQIRAMFAIILAASDPSSPAEIWERDKSHIAEDIFCRIRKKNLNMSFTAEISNEPLTMIEDQWLKITNNVLNQLVTPSPNRSDAAKSFNVELRREKNYKGDLLSYAQSNIRKVTREQKGIYNQIMHFVKNAVGEISFQDTPGWSG